MKSNIFTLILTASVLGACGLAGCDAAGPDSSQTLTLSAEGSEQAARYHQAASEAELLIAFDEASGQLPEGIAVDKTGNIFVSIAPLGQVWKVSPGSSTPDLFGAVAGIDPAAGDIGLLGLAVDAPGNLYAGVQSTNPDVNGVWRFDRRTGAAERLPGTEAIAFANDVAFDKRGNLYITDSVLGAIWRMPKHGELAPWLVGDENLAGTGALGLGAPIGANGIEFRQGTLYVANTEKSLLLAIPVAPDGTPGTSEVVAVFPEIEVAPGVTVPGVPDGLALDVHGNVFVAQVGASRIVRVSPDGDITEVAFGDPLDWPSSIAFGTGRGHQQTLFGVNFSIGEQNGDTVERMGPGLFALDAGVPGMPLP